MQWAQNSGKRQCPASVLAAASPPQCSSQKWPHEYVCHEPAHLAPHAQASCDCWLARRRGCQLAGCMCCIYCSSSSSSVTPGMRSSLTSNMTAEAGATRGRPAAARGGNGSGHGKCVWGWVGWGGGVGGYGGVAEAAAAEPATAPATRLQNGAHGCVCAPPGPKQTSLPPRHPPTCGQALGERQVAWDVEAPQAAGGHRQQRLIQARDHLQTAGGQTS